MATIMEAPMLEKPPPALDKYDDSTYPDDHLRTFVNAMALYSSSDPVMCRAFSLSLKGEALAWYNTLPPNIVDCFATVETLYGRQYASSQVQELTHVALVSIRQEKEETLKAFMKRYNETTRRVKDVNQTLIINNLSSCLKVGPFVDSCARPPKIVDELQERAAKFIRIEDIRISRKRDGRRPFGSNDKGGGSCPKDLPRIPRFNHYTALNSPREKILQEALNSELIPSVKKKPTPRNGECGHG
ncbi:uncharacterized protein LOC124845717 [Vigna umbellata]|uniref:uncharacterized protein LOC124845717 n=1 Tax=Vigna umbellata TaxID=87088 RepID=UPI001F5F60AD|nr:uncharacterized protein LOC124845717 [Vigna umbellata]